MYNLKTENPIWPQSKASIIYVHIQSHNSTVSSRKNLINYLVHISYKLLELKRCKYLNSNAQLQKFKMLPPDKLSTLKYN